MPEPPGTQWHLQRELHTTAEMHLAMTGELVQAKVSSECDAQCEAGMEELAQR